MHSFYSIFNLSLFTYSSAFRVTLFLRTALLWRFYHTEVRSLFLLCSAQKTTTHAYQTLVKSYVFFNSQINQKVYAIIVYFQTLVTPLQHFKLMRKLKRVWSIRVWEQKSIVNTLHYCILTSIRAVRSYWSFSSKLAFASTRTRRHSSFLFIAACAC